MENSKASSAKPFLFSGALLAGAAGLWFAATHLIASPPIALVSLMVAGSAGLIGAITGVKALANSRKNTEPEAEIPVPSQERTRHPALEVGVEIPQKDLSGRWQEVTQPIAERGIAPGR